MITYRLDKALERRKRSLYWLAKETGIGYTILLRIKQNKTECIKKWQMNLICNALKVKPEHLIEYTPD